MKSISKKRQDYLDKMLKMSNDELFMEVYSLVGGDTYDGCFTSWGSFCFDNCQPELLRRLKASKFLSEKFDIT